MKTLQAGNKAVLNGKDIVTIIAERGDSSIVMRDTVGQSIHDNRSVVSNKELQPVYIVRVLQDGRAREVNPMGDAPRITTTFVEFAQGHEKVFEDQIRNEKWHAAESQCLTLECEPHEVDGLTGKIFFMSCDWTKDIAVHTLVRSPLLR